MTIFLLIAAIVCLALSVVNILGIDDYRKKLAEIKANPPFMKCPTCELTILGNDPVSQQVHVLCIIKSHEMIEAEKAKAIEAPKSKGGKYKIKIEQETKKGTPSDWNQWSFDDSAKTWYRFFWTVKTEDGYLLDSGYHKHDWEAENTAEAVAERHREGEREYEF